MIELESNERSRDQIAIVSRPLGRGIVVVVSGEIDLATAPTVERELLQAEESHDLVAIDLSATTFMDSTGLHAIMAADLRLRERGGRLLIVKGPPQVSRLFELTGLSNHLHLVRDETELGRLAANGNDR
jgi:anti-anti-sigma factor